MRTIEQRREDVLYSLRELESWLAELAEAGIEPDPGAFRLACDHILIRALGGSTTAPYPYLVGTGCPALDTACSLVGIGAAQWYPMIGEFDDLPGQEIMRLLGSAGARPKITTVEVR